jgi:hypothetical protein
MRKCRDCTTLIDNHLLLCDKCRMEAGARTKEKGRLKDRQAAVKRVKNRRIILRQKPIELKPPHKCATSGCQQMVNGRAKFCAECGHKRRLIRQREYCRNKKHYVDPLPTEPPTSYKFLDDMNAYLKQNGGVYYKHNR